MESGAGSGDLRRRRLGDALGLKEIPFFHLPTGLMLGKFIQRQGVGGKSADRLLRGQKPQEVI